MAGMEGKRLTNVNQKGGDGKAKVSVNLSLGLVKRKSKIILIDLGRTLIGSFKKYLS